MPEIWVRKMVPEKFEPEKLQRYELLPVLTSMFNEKDQMHPATKKSNSENALEVEASNWLSEGAMDAIFLDGCTMLWIIPWPPEAANIQDYV